MEATPGLPPVAGTVATPVPHPESATTTDAGNVAVAAKDHQHPAANDVVNETGIGAGANDGAETAKVLPLGGDVHPDHQAEALKDAPDHLVEAQIEKTREAAREHHGLPEQGSVVPGFEDSKLWALRRAFDAVSTQATRCSVLQRAESLLSRIFSKFFTSYRLRPNYPKVNLISVHQLYPTFHSIPT